MGIYASHDAYMSIPVDKAAAFAAKIAEIDEPLAGLEPEYKADAPLREQMEFALNVVKMSMGGEEALDATEILEKDGLFLYLGAGFGKISFDHDDVVLAIAEHGGEGYIDVTLDDAHERYRFLNGKVLVLEGKVVYPDDPVDED